MSARGEVAQLLAQHSLWFSGLVERYCTCGLELPDNSPESIAAHQADILMAEDWIDDRPVPCGSEAYIPSDYYRTENYGWVRCGGYLGEGHIHEDSNTGYQWDDAGNPLR